MNKYFDYFGKLSKNGVYQSVNKKAIDRASAYAKEWVRENPSLYSGRNQGNLTIVLEQLTHGKIAEEALTELFRKNGIETSEPDYRVMSEKEKKKGGWKHDADLVIHNGEKTYKIHKKTRSVKNAVNWNNVSWLMEKNCLKKSKFDEDDYICGGLIFQENNDYFAHCIFLTGFKMLEAQKRELFGPTDDKGKNSKKALYYDNIPNNVRSVGFKNTILNSDIKKMELFRELKLC
tara:strand:+ start:211 stop:909 length:699 start_codon:yes stop_codon:yes gene_type:complete